MSIMNRKASKNVQQNRGKSSRPVSLGSSGAQRRTKRSMLSPESGINFLVNVSSSGTNLNRKIEQQMAKIENVEKKIRNYKSKCPARIPTAATTNQKKLRSVLENMLAAIDSEPKKSRRHNSPYHHKTSKKTENDSFRKIAKPRKYMISDVVCESLTSFVNKNKKISTPKSDVTKEGTAYKKPVLKKPFSTPTEHYKSLREDLKFAEKLNFGKNVDLGLEASNPKSDLQNSVPPQRVQNENATINDVNIEKSSRKALTYVYESTSTNLISPPVSPKTQSNYGSIAKKKKSERKQLLEICESSKTEQSFKEVKVCRKKIYSTLTRGNFTISNHTGVCDSDGKDEYEEDTKFEVIEETEEINEDIGEGDNNNSKDHRIDQNLDADNEVDGTGNDGETFPMDLLERSILAVESVLRTINSMTNEFGSEEIKNTYSEDESMLDKISNSLEAFTTTSIDNLLVNLEEASRKSASNSSSVSRDQSNMKVEKSLQTIRVHARSRSDTTLQQRKMSTKTQNPRNQNREFYDVEGNTRKVIYLKTPIKLFQESEENFVMKQQFTTDIHEKRLSETRQSHQQREEMEPLKTALNTLRSRISAIRKQVMDVPPPKNDTFRQTPQFKHSHIENSFSDNSSIASCSVSRQWSSDDSAKINYSYPFCPKRGIKKWSNHKNQAAQKIFKKSSELKVFPEYNFERCLTLLSRKFKDFEMTRRGKWKEKTNNTATNKKQYMEGDGLPMRETCERYTDFSLGSNKVGDFATANNKIYCSKTTPFPDNR